MGRRSFVIGALAVAATACGDDSEQLPATSTSAPPSTRPRPAATSTPESAPRGPGRFAYGSGPDQVGDLHLPEGRPPAEGWPVVVLIHGGFWRDGFSRTLMTPLALSATDAGIAAWNIDYRSSDHPEGGWPGTFEDVAAAVDALAGLDAPLDPDRVVTVGHSAGGHLALWAAGRRGLPDGAPGAAPAVAVTGAIAQAAVSDLAACARSWLGDGACVRLMGAGPDEAPVQYGLASPVERLPLGVPQVLIHGSADQTVPVSQSRDYARTAQEKGDPITYVEVDGAGHFDPIDPRHPSWKLVLDALPELDSVRP